jgi:hypothetical protein
MTSKVTKLNRVEQGGSLLSDHGLLAERGEVVLCKIATGGYAARVTAGPGSYAVLRVRSAQAVRTFLLARATAARP